MTVQEYRKVKFILYTCIYESNWENENTAVELKKPRINLQHK